MHQWPYYSENEIAAVAAVLRSGKVNYWTGDEVHKFEKEFADFCHTKYAVAVANGTVALELALRALGIGPGDEVVVPSSTFVATASAVALCGARAVFADVDQDSQNITADTIRPVISPHTKAIITVHLAGWPCEMEPILELASMHNLKIIEDCAQAHGATYKGRPVGSIGDVAAFSFCQDKIISTGGEGGMLVTNNPQVWEKAWSFKDHGKSFAAVNNRHHKPGFRWLHNSFGTNSRMTEMQAAIGRLQLEALPEWHSRRSQIAARLTRCFEKIPALRVVRPPAHIEHAYYKYDVFVRPEVLKTGWSRDLIMQAINREGVPCFTGPCSEVYLEKAFESNKLRPVHRLPVARKLGETELAFLVHPTLTDEEVEATCEIVENVLMDVMKKSQYVDKKYKQVREKDEVIGTSFL